MTDTNAVNSSARASTPINLAEATTMAFRDPRWLQKLGLLVLFGCIPGLNLIAWLGYQQSIAYTRAIGSEALPSWDDWADILVRGLVSITASGLYFLPAIIAGLLATWSGSGKIAPLLLIGSGVLALIGALALYAAHIRSAQSDQASEYGLDGWRGRWNARQGLTVPGAVFLIGWIAQIAIFIAALLLTIPALFTLIGVVIVWSAVSVINGYVIGQVAANNRLYRE